MFECAVNFIRKCVLPYSRTPVISKFMCKMDTTIIVAVFKNNVGEPV